MPDARAGASPGTQSGVHRAWPVTGADRLFLTRVPATLMRRGPVLLLVDLGWADVRAGDLAFAGAVSGTGAREQRVE